MVESAKAEGGKEIPVPKVTRVPSYNTDYLPTFREPNTYIRGRGRAYDSSSLPVCGPFMHATHAPRSDWQPQRCKAVSTAPCVELII